MTRAYVCATHAPGSKEDAMTIVVAADPSGRALKESIRRHLEGGGNDVLDVGSTDGRDVPFYGAARNACRLIQEGKAERGILCCGTGAGVAIVAGKHRGIVAVCVESVYAARLSRAINDANVLCLGAMIWGETMAKAAVDAFLSTAHTEGFEASRGFLLEAAREVARIEESCRRE